MGIGLCQGTYQDTERKWLGWYDTTGNWIPTRTDEERQRAEQERQEKELAQQWAERLAARLRELGVNPEQL